jgi:hypothetical protein
VQPGRVGVLAAWKAGPDLLTCRQTEPTSGLVANALTKDAPDGLPPATLAGICDDMLEASIPDEFKHASTALAADWTDAGTFSLVVSRAERRIGSFRTAIEALARAIERESPSR